MSHASNIIRMPGLGRPQRLAQQSELATALERAQPAIAAACAGAKGLRTAHRTRMLQQIFGPRSTGTT
ncbi:hypothetical protein [Salipiger sp. PrR007]|uniref:hypothetical protein n=1 Tax=Salipiger sp. PrR007 TaxID=2706884 RepID=UPI0013B9EBD4|nr:hypothetical protein [Salipiger sp. PrR007]NDW34618.1 hypothetical protein [Salipiger sp. PrR007]